MIGAFIQSKNRVESDLVIAALTAIKLSSFPFVENSCGRARSRLYPRHDYKRSPSLLSMNYGWIIVDAIYFRSVE